MTTFVEAASVADADDIDALNAAAQLERAAIAAYTDPGAVSLLSPPVLAIAGSFVADHSAHLSALVGAIRAAGARVDDTSMHVAYPVMTTQADVLRFALSLEKKAAATYLSVIADFKNRKLAEVAASILGVETTHVALLSNALGDGKQYPSGFVA
jgi:hypothetical protein